jgi:lipopolysaccharide transport system ATP-binding protein|tara:strand:+ start:81 stop:1409 length:1329 start_codon:yes stop_codon:yes gene_type:complete
MSDIAIEVSNLSKRYRIGLREEIHDTFIGSITSWLRSPVSNYKRVHNLSSFSDNGEPDDIIWALKEISFDVNYGEVLGIIGKNGAGKSTLLKILCRIAEPTSGRAVVNGRVSSLLEVGTGFHSELTGRENVYLNGAILGMTKKEMDQKFDEIVDFSGIEKFIDTPVKRYSSGMGVRLAFAVAAHLEPEILLIDEVLAVGDFEFRKKCLGKMQDVASEGRTVLFVSHNMSAVTDLCNRVILLHRGKIDEIGPTEEMIKKYIWGDRKELMGKGEKTWVKPSKTNWPKGVIPGKELAHLRAVRVLNEAGELCTKFTVRDNIYLEMECEIFRDANYMDIGFNILNDRGLLVFVMGDNSRDSDNRRGRSGLFRFTGKIPGDLLNDGLYFVWASLTEDNHIVHIRERDAVSFFVEDSMDPEGARGYYIRRKWPESAVRPKIEWKNSLI